MVLPQEIQLWYVLPALRRELVKALISRHRMQRKMIAKALGISEGAVSQYLSSKRGVNVKFSLGIVRQIELSSDLIASGDSSAMPELVRLSGLPEVKRMVCKIHMMQDPFMKKNCSICFAE